MPVLRWSSLSVLVVFAMGCSDGITGPPTGFAHAAVTFACGSADGPAVAIYLSPNPVQTLEPSGPYVHIHIDQAVEQVGGQTWSVGSNGTAGAVFQLTPTDYETATDGYVITTSVSADKTVEGILDVTFPKAGHIRGTFHAEWISRPGFGCI
jgi:hypothetical protein